MRRQLFCRLSVFLCALLVLSSPRFALAATTEQVNAAIDKAQKYLLAHRNPKGNWEEVDKPQTVPKTKDEDLRANPNGRQWGGRTAIATYALLASGKDWRDPQMTPPVEFLLHANIEGTYALGLSSQLALFLPVEKTRLLLLRNSEMIQHGMWLVPGGVGPLKWPPQSGFYGYWTGDPNGSGVPVFTSLPKKFGAPQPAGWYDRSASQYAVLGMWALERAGAKVAPGYWQTVDTAWKRAEQKNGGWNYREEADVTPAMTAAGVATLFITQDYASTENAGSCKGGIHNEFIERGLAYMDSHIEEAIGGSFYTLYGIERIGAASGRRYFGSRKDWYKLGADTLLKNQKEDGSWESDHGPIPDTSFGLLFLSRGRAPLLMNKLQYTVSDAKQELPDVWNERPRDLANLAQWMGGQLETFFNWQVVDLSTPQEEMHDAPILYISGSKILSFSEDEKAKLRAYCERGGLILGNADCGMPAFAQSFTKLGEELFPKYKFQTVSNNDLIWHEQYNQWRLKPKVLELTNGVRKLMVLIPEADLARAWQGRQERTREVMYQLAANIYLYAIDLKNSRPKDDTYLETIKPTTQPATQPAKSMTVARLELGEAPDPEPGGWVQFSAVMANRFHVKLDTRLAKPNDLDSVKIAHLTGTGKLTLTAQQRLEIKAFVQRGGTLIVDAAGGSAIFADSADAELEAIFGVGKLTTIPLTDPLYNDPRDKITTIGWRRFAQDHVADHKRPQIRGIAFGNRYHVFCSREDLSAGLVGQAVDGIVGYDPQTSTDLMAAMILYASK